MLPSRSWAAVSALSLTLLYEAQVYAALIVRINAKINSGSLYSIERPRSDHRRRGIPSDSLTGSAIPSTSP